jgi:predicted  nucleic acid-binding Zn-ribbon protein
VFFATFVVLIRMPTSEELLDLADQAAKKVDLEGKLHHIPSFSDAEEQCENEYEELLQAIHDDEVFESVDVERQETLVEQIAAALPEEKRMMIVELADNFARHIWLQQEGAYHLGLAIGKRLKTKSVS